MPVSGTVAQTAPYANERGFRRATRARSGEREPDASMTQVGDWQRPTVVVDQRGAIA
jgi:hypothetical protein